MNENDMLNRDVMFWREITYYLPSDSAEIDLYAPIIVDGEEVHTIICSLLPYQADHVIYELENGGAMKRNEVIDWPFISPKNREQFANLNTVKTDDNPNISWIKHDKVKSIRLKNKKGSVIFEKTKI